MITKQILAGAFLLLTVLTPNMRVLPGLPTFRGEDLVVALLLGSGILALLSGGGARLTLRDPITRSFRFMAVIVVVSIAGSVLVFGNPLILNDGMILPMLLKYWIVFRLAQSLVDHRSRLFALWAGLIAVTMSAVVGILQYHSLFGVNDWLTPRYIGDQVTNVAVEEEESGETVWSRVVGTHGDPRHFGYMLVAGIGAGVSLLSQRVTKGARLLSLLAIGVCVVATIYTLSRTAVLSLAVTVLACMVLHARGSGKSGSKTLVLALVLAGLIIGVFEIFSTSGFESRVLDTETDSFDSSAYARHRDLVTPFRDAMKNPMIFLIGRGPSKAVMRTDSHNDFGWYFHRFGLPGLGFYLLLLYRGLSVSYRAYRATPFPGEKAVFMAAFLVAVNWAVFAMAENIFKDPQLMALNMFFVGLLYPSPSRAHTEASPSAAFPESDWLRGLRRSPLRVPRSEGVGAELPGLSEYFPNGVPRGSSTTRDRIH
jgi:hypothetical protein